MSNPKYKHFGTPYIRLMEECSELIQSICKIERFGLYSHHPDKPEYENNLFDLLIEISDVEEAIKDLKDHLMDLGHYVD